METAILSSGSIPIATVSLSTGDIVTYCLAVIAAVGGFVAGMCYARSAGRRSLARTKNNLSGLYDHVLKSIDVAQDACRVLETFPKLQLSLEQFEKLDVHRVSLVETMQRIADGQQAAAANEPEEQAVITIPEMTWTRTPEHSVTKLPNRSALDSNAELMIRTGEEGEFQSGVLLVKMDKVDDLKKRFGLAGIQNFQRRLSTLICRSMRDADIVCYYSPETFAVLMPGIDVVSGREAADAIRQAVRRHHFRPSDKGPEVLVTASFGFAISSPGESSELLLSRAESAVSRSQQKGRNQLHCDDGRQLVLCND